MITLVLLLVAQFLALFAWRARPKGCNGRPADRKHH